MAGRQDVEPPPRVEPLLDPAHARRVILPIHHPDLWELYQKQIASFWKVEEVDLSHDLAHWNKTLTDSERHFVTHVLGFFAASDSIVNENLVQRFQNEVQYPEAQFFYAQQAAMENIHSLMYALLIETYVADPAERHRVTHAIDTMPCVRRKADWALAWIASDAPFAQRLVGFACVEGILFSSSFCAIYWLKSRGLMPGLCHSNELIARDEGQHQDFAAHLYAHHLAHKLDEATVHAIVGGAVAEEVHFCTEALSVALLGMNAADMAEYVRFVADRLLTQLGVAKLYHAHNPFPFMELLSLEGKTNFFERRVGEYQLALGGAFSTTAAF